MSENNVAKPKGLSATSYLFVPAINIGRVEKAFARGADTVIIDLEDAVSDSVKMQSRDNVVNYLSGADASLFGCVSMPQVATTKQAILIC